MKRTWLHLSRALTMAALLGLPAISAPAHAQAPVDYVPGEVVVKLARVTDLASVAASHALNPTPIDQFGARAIYRMRILDGVAPLNRAAALAADSRVVYAEPNYLGGTPEGQQRVSWAKGDDDDDDDDVAYAEQWAVSMIRLPEAHTISRGAGVTVAVLDTGVDPAHPALAGRLVSGFDFVDLDADPSEVGAREHNVVYGHGTHVAGLVALVAPEADIMPLRVLNQDGVGNIWVIAEALAYAVNPDGDLSTDDGADVINLSLSTDRHTNLLTEVEDDVACNDDDNPRDCLAGPQQRGAVVVAAAGNGGSNAPEYPAAEGVSGSLAVAASTTADELAAFSSHGSWVHVAAPGDQILSSVPGGQYGVWSGTSMATPLVAGQAALVRAVHSSLRSASVVNRILATSADIGGLVPRRIDVAAALGIPPISYSGEYVCVGALGPVRADNILVPPGHTCELVGTRIKGGIKVEDGATLHASGINVQGSLQAKKAADVVVTNSAFAGGVQVEEGVAARLASSRVGSGVKFEKNTGTLVISNNTVNGNLQCKENSQAPTGGGNVVSGNKEDQCAGL